MPGPNRTPTQLRAIAGTVRPDRIAEPGVELPLLESVPEAPDWLVNAHAKREWERLTPVLVANKLLTVTSLSTLGHFCNVHGKLVQLWAAGECPTGHLLAQYNALGSAFGLAPGWASKVKPVGDPDKKNPFDKFKNPAG